MLNFYMILKNQKINVFQSKILFPNNIFIHQL